MTPNFHLPQKQSGLGIVVLFVEFTIKLFRAMLFPAIIFLVRGSWSSLGVMALILLSIFLLAFINAFLSYKYLSFYIDADKKELILRKGFLNKEQITIKLEKIQQVNLNQNFVQKILDLYAVQIDTAGGDSAEVSLKALEEPVALALKAALLENQSEQQEILADSPVDLNNTTTEAKSNFIKLDFPTLFKIGISSNYRSSIAILLGFLITMANQIQEWRELIQNEEETQTGFKEFLPLLSTGLFFFIAFILLIGIHVFRTFYKFSNFEISLRNQALHLSSGLFNRKSTHLRPRNVQITAVSQNYFQKLLGFFQIQLKQANGIKQSEKEEARQSNLEIPGASPAEKEIILDLVFKDQPHTNLSLSANFRYMYFPILLYILIPLSILAGWNYFNENLGKYNLLAIPYVLLCLWMIYRSYKNHQLGLSEHFIILQTGAWDVTEHMLLPEKIQSLDAYQYLWHKALNIGHLNIHTAGGTLRFRFGNFSDIQELKNYWLYKVEQSARDWN